MWLNVQRCRISKLMPAVKPRSVYQVVLVAAFVCFAAQAKVSAATFTVNTLLDNEVNTCSIGNCTLREAVIDANSAPGDDTVLFNPSLQGTIVVTGALGITTNITITGPGPRILSVLCAVNRVFSISGASAVANIHGLTIMGNNVGGGITNSGGSTLNISEVALVNNRAAVGGGVSTRNGAITNITSSLIANNAATAGGGGVELQTPSVVTISNSTVTGNTAVNAGGGIGSLGGTVNLINVTVSHNTVTGVGNGAGIGNFNAGILNLRNSLITQNTNASGLPDDVAGFPPTSFGGNVIAESRAVLPFGNPNSDGDRIGSSQASPPVIITIFLGPLQNNGGATDTRMLGEGSLAIDWGSNCVVNATCSGLNPLSPLSTDQRGASFPRRRGSRVDSGAFEAISTTVFAAAPFDFDGDSKTDIGIFRPSVAEWWINKSADGQTFAAQFGASTDKLAPGDYTGDGKADIAIWRPSSGEWFILRSEDSSFFSFPFGTAGDTPTPADYDADGKIDAAVFRTSSATWFIRRSTGGTTIETFGAKSDVPVTADYDGDAKSDIAIYRPSLGQWWINRSTAGVVAFTFGTPTDKPVQGDYTGDGKADVAFWRPSTGEWYILRSEDFSYYSQPFGMDGDIPSPGDYDGDGKFDPTVFRPSSATWFSARSTAGTLIQQFGATGDAPIPSAFLP